MLKVLFVLEVFTFLSILFGYVEKRPDKKKQRLVIKCMTSQIGQQIITIHIYSYISRNRGNRQTFSQLTNIT